MEDKERTRSQSGLDQNLSNLKMTPPTMFHVPTRMVSQLILADLQNVWHPKMTPSNKFDPHTSYFTLGDPWNPMMTPSTKFHVQTIMEGHLTLRDPGNHEPNFKMFGLQMFWPCVTHVDPELTFKMFDIQWWWHHSPSVHVSMVSVWPCVTNSGFEPTLNIFDIQKISPPTKFHFHTTLDAELTLNDPFLTSRRRCIRTWPKSALLTKFGSRVK